MLDRRQWKRVALAAAVTLAACRSSQPALKHLSDEEIIANKPAGTNAIIVHGIGYGRAAIGIAGASPTCEDLDFESSHYSQTCWAYVPVTTPSVTVSVVPVGGGVFLGWGAAPCSATTASTCELPMDVDRIIGVKVDPGGAAPAASEHRLTVRVLGFVDGDVTAVASPPPPGGAVLACLPFDPGDRVSFRQQCLATFPAGTIVTLTPSPRPGTTFAGWGGACSGTGPCTVTMNADRTVTAGFVAGSGGTTRPPDAAALVGPGGGTVRVESAASPIQGVSLTFPPGSFLTDTLVTITHRPDVAAPLAGASRQSVSLPVFEIAPPFDGLPAPATLRIPVPDANRDGVVDGTDFPVEDAQLYYRLEGDTGWTGADAAATADGAFVEAQTTHASQWDVVYWRWKPNTCVRYAIRNDPGLPPSSATFDRAKALSELQQAFDAWAESVGTYAVRFSTDCEGTTRVGESMSEEAILVGLDSQISSPSFIAAANLGIDIFFERYLYSSPATMRLKLNPKFVFSTAPYAVDPPFADSLHQPWLRTVLHEGGHLMGLPEFSNGGNTGTRWNLCSAGTSFYLPGGVVMWYDDCDALLPLVRLSVWDRTAVAAHYGVLRAPTFTRLTTDPSRDVAPIWKSSGELLFQSNRGNARTNTNDVWRMNADGTAQQKLVQVNVTTPISWGDPGLGNPIELLGATGDLVVYEAQTYHEIMRVRLSQATALPIVRTVQDGPDTYFSRLLFVPGGQSASNLAYDASTGMAAWVAHTPGGHRLRTAAFTSLSGQNTDSYGTLLASVGTSGMIHSVGYSPDGTKLAVAMSQTYSSTVRPDIYVLDASNGAVLQRVTTSGESGTDNQFPRWSPRGDRLAFQAFKDGQWSVWTATPTSTPAPTRLATPGQAYWPAWSPDGASLAFVGIGTDGNEDIWIARNVAP